MAGLSALAAGCVTTCLAGCGASHTSASTPVTATHSKSALVTGAHSARNGTCTPVSKPQPRGPQHIPKPTSTLSPAKDYLVVLQTNCGAIEIELAATQAPKIAASFAYLVKGGFYDDLTFHRIVAGFVIQGGDPNGDGSGGPGYTVIEPPPKRLRYRPGVVAMAKAATDPPGAAGSQFFIVIGSHVDLPPQYALLGKVVRGWRTVLAISKVQTSPGPDGEDSSPSTPIVISKATLITR